MVKPPAGGFLFVRRTAIRGERPRSDRAEPLCGPESNRKIIPINAAKAECQHVDAGTENKRHAHEVRQQNRSAESQDNSEQASEAGEHDGFNKELKQHFPLGRADRQTHTDFFCALRHTYQHDVHNADAADQKTDRCHGTEKHRQHLRSFGNRFNQLRGVKEY